MTPEDLPLVGRLLRFGPEDPVYDSLILAGPPLLVVVRLAGRSVVTEALAAAYLLAFVGYFGYRAATRESPARSGEDDEAP